MSEDKAARHEESRKAGSSKTGQKRMASTEDPRGPAKEKKERVIRQRTRFLHKKCQLEKDIESIDAELTMLDQSDESDFSLCFPSNHEI